jgi:hypothetical protein
MLALERIEWLVAILLSLTVLFLLIVRATHAGALWRDECDSVQLAQMPRFADMLANLHFTAFPILFPTTIRIYSSLFGASDFAFRAFTLLVGVGFIAATWFYSLSINRQPPLLLLAVIGLNSNFLTEAMSIRGYGIGVVLLIMAITLAARMIERPTVPRWIAMSLSLLVATQCVVFNGAFAPGILLAAIVVMLLHRQIRFALLLAATGLLIGLAYLPYFFGIYFKVRSWVVLLQESAPFATLWNLFIAACGSPTSVMPWVWLSLILVAVVWGGWRLKSVWNHKQSTERDLLLFALIIIFTSIPAFSLFSWISHKPLLSRYYLILFCVVAMPIDLILGRLCRHNWFRVARVIAVVVAMITLPFAVWPVITQRSTNIDIVARTLEKDASVNDVIIVNSWSRGISFNRYYHGPTRWLTVPNIGDHRMHRYDLLQAKMTEFFPLSDLEEAMTGALKSGNRVWVVDDFRVPLRGRRPMVLAPAPDPQYGWRSIIYSFAWAQQLVFFLRQHILKSSVVAEPQPFVNQQENASLIVVEGWQ